MPEYLAPATLAYGRTCGESGGVDAAGPPPGPNGGIDPTPGWLAAAFTPNMVRTHATIGLFASTTTGDDALEQPVAFRDALDRCNAGGSIVIFPKGDGSQVELPQCCFAGPAASGFFVFDPSDIGTGPGQVNPDPTLLTAAQLRPHPSVFIRKPQHVRAIYSQQREDTPLPPIAGASAGVLGITVDRPPTFSAWVLGVDGHQVFAGFAHPAGSDFRRPGDIWRHVVVPAIELANSTAGAIDNLEWWGGSGPVATIYRRGLLTRLHYVEYARFWAARDLDTTPNYTPLWLIT